MEDGTSKQSGKRETTSWQPSRASRIWINGGQDMQETYQEKPAFKWWTLKVLTSESVGHNSSRRPPQGYLVLKSKGLSACQALR